MSNDKRVLIYCRESRDDNSENYERIETQRDILIDFCKKQKYTNIVDIILDDNMSGTKFERLDKVKTKIEKKEIDVIVFKDASRLGRNLLECMDFIRFAENYNTEVVFESETYNEDFFPLQAWFNEQRAKEDSKKVRKVFEYKMSSGELLIRPVYGYKKIDDKLVVNEEQAEVVRKIFDLFINGTGTHAIATILNFEKIPTPSQANNQRRVCYAWNKQHIHRILNDEIYTGRKIYHKKTRKSFKNRKVVPVDKADWIIVENHHEPIITQEIYDKAQAQKKDCILTNYRGVRTALFAGLVYCGRCGSTMLRIVRKGRNTAYICSKYRYEGALKNDIRPNYGCVTHHIAEEDLIKEVKKYLASLLCNDTTQEIYFENLKRKQKSAESKEIQLINIKKEIDDIENKIGQMYEDKLDGILPQNIYIKKLNEFNTKLTTLKNEYEKFSNTQIKDQRQIDMNVVRKMVYSGEIDNKSLKQAITKIIIYVPNEISEKDKLEYDISDEWFNDIKTNGGMIIQSYGNDLTAYIAI